MEKTRTNQPSGYPKTTAQRVAAFRRPSPHSLAVVLTMVLMLKNLICPPE